MADPLAEALDALEHVQSDPRRTRDVALRLLDGGADGERRVVALWALGRAQQGLNARSGPRLKTRLRSA